MPPADKPEDNLQPLRCAFVQIRRDGRQGVCHHIPATAALSQLGNVKLEGRFHGVQEHRILFPAVLSRQSELPAEHPLYQLQQQRLLAGKTWKNELCPMPAAFAISPVVVFV